MDINEIATRVTAGPSQSTPRPQSAVPAAPDMAPPTSTPRAPDSPPAAMVRDETRQSERVDLSQAVEKLNSLVQQLRRELHFSVDDASGHVIIRVFNSETNELVREIPPEQVMTVMERLQGSGSAMMLDATA